MEQITATNNGRRSSIEVQGERKGAMEAEALHENHGKRWGEKKKIVQD